MAWQHDGMYTWRHGTTGRALPTGPPLNDPEASKGQVPGASMKARERAERERSMDRWTEAIGDLGKLRAAVNELDVPATGAHPLAQHDLMLARRSMTKVFNLMDSLTDRLMTARALVQHAGTTDD